MKLFSHFDDAELERAYVVSARTASSGSFQFVMALASAVLIFYFVLNPYYLTSSGVNGFNDFAFALLILVVIVYSYISR